MNAAISPDTFAAPVSVRAATPSRVRVWTGRVITGLLSAFLLWDAWGKLSLAPIVVEYSAKVGLDKPRIFAIGLTLLVSLIVHLIPRTAVIGAVLLTGYLGGAICTHVLFNDGAFSMGFALAFGALVWTGLYLRDSRVAALIQPKA